MTVMVYRANGKIEDHTSQFKGGQPGLKWLQEQVDGLIEYVGFKDGDMVINEEGKLLDLAFNQKATEMWVAEYGNTDAIVGDVVFMSGDHYLE